MQRVGFIMKLKKEKIEEYKKAHKNVWPSVIEACKKAGIHNYSIFLRGRNLFAYMEVDDWDKTMEVLGKDKANIRWQEKMSSSMEKVDDLKPDEPLALMEEVLHLD